MSRINESGKTQPRTVVVTETVRLQAVRTFAQLPDQALYVIDESSALNVFGGFFTKIARRTLLKNIIGVTLRYTAPHRSSCRAVYMCAGQDLCHAYT